MSLAELLRTPKAALGATLIETLVFAYLRVSHRRSAEKNLSPETQRQLIEDYAASKGYKIVRWYEDMATSAFRDDDPRPEYERMLADAKADPAISVVLVAYFDRFSRAPGAAGAQSDLLRHGVRIESATEGYHDPTTEEGLILGNFTWTFSHLHSLKIRNKVVPCMRVNFKDRDPETGWAYKNGGWALFGYKPERIPMGRNTRYADIHKLIWLKDDRVFGGKQVWEWVRIMLLEWRLKEKLGYDSIAQRLTNAGIPTPSGNKDWSNSTVQSILGEWDRLYQYAGYAFWNREDCTDKRKRVRRDESEWVVTQDAHPAIITEKECDAIFAMVKDAKRTKTSRQGKASRWALSGGLLRCKHCGTSYAGSGKRGDDRYRCGAHIYRRGAGCVRPSWGIPREALEEVLFGVIMGMLESNNSALQAEVDRVNRSTQSEWQAFQKTAQERAYAMDGLRSQLKTYYDLAATTGITDELRARIAEATQVLAQLEAMETAVEPEMVDAEEIKAARDDLYRLAESGDPEAAQLILKQFVVEMTVDSGKKTVEGILRDPRSFDTRCMAAPRGVEPLSRP